MSSSLVPFPIHVCGIEELEGHCATGVSHVLSILDPDRAKPEAFGRYGEHARLELRFHDIIEEQEGQVAPELEQVAAILDFGRGLLAEPAPGCWCIAMSASPARRRRWA